MAEKESHLRSILKGLSWRLVATATLIGLAYWKTGSIEFALELGAVEFVVKFLLYYLHERAWQFAPRGSIRKFFKR